VKCPICVQEVQPSDHPELWGPEFAHSRCIIAFNAGSAVQDAKLQVRIKRLEAAGDALKAAGYFGGWADAVNKWIKAKEAKP
jgi:hypothetical protein